MSHVIVMLATMAIASPTTEATLPSSLDLSGIRAMVVQYDGRWPPLDTAAREIVETVTGDVFYQGHDPMLVLLGWTFDPRTWMNAPLIEIANAQLRAELELPPDQTGFSYAELATHQRLLSLIGELNEVQGGRKLNPLEAKVSDLNERLVLLQQVFFGRVIRPIPDAESISGAWRAIPVQATGESPAIDKVVSAWTGLRGAFVADDAAAFSAETDKLLTALRALPAAHRPAPELIDTELRYNRLRPWRTAWIVMLGGAALAAVAMFVRRRWFDAVAVLGMLAGFGLLTYGLSMRWQIAGRIPAANMFESLLFLSWGMGAFAILAVFFLRHRIVPLTASAMGALALILADCLPIDPYIRPIAPVLLDTIWMSIHVPIIMVSYSVLALAVLFAHVQLVVMAVRPSGRELARTIDSLHYWYVHVGSFLLLAGIVTGSIWAASSWGRYWGWDPKEVWSLVAFLGYLAILHVRIDRETMPSWIYVVGGVLVVGMFVLVLPKFAPLTGPKLLAFAGTALAMVVVILARGAFATAVKSILAFWLIVMTYVGVNYVLGIGLHSYAFGTGAVVRYMFLLGGLDLLLVVLCALIYLLRRPSLPAPA